MKNNAITGVVNSNVSYSLKQFLLVMKLTTILLIITLVQVSAKGLSQNISIEGRNIPIKEVIKSIETQSLYTFFYDINDLPDVNVSLNLKDATINEVLNAVFRSIPEVAYKVVKSNVVITKVEVPKPITVKGTVNDDKGIPIPGVNVYIKRTLKGTSTDAYGRYSIDVELTDTLVFSCLGYLPKVISVSDGGFAINNVATVDISLQPDVKAIEEVVVVSTGYQNIKKEKVTGATVTLGAKQLETKNVTNILDNLEGTVPGLVRYNGTTTIRGVGTLLNENSDVLVVVDGLPIEGSIEDINPYDVESVTVLKDAAAAAIYGARASNGVIVVVTKKAKGFDKFSVEVSSNISYFQKPDYGNYHYMTPAQQVEWESNYYNWSFNSGNYGSVTDMVDAVYSNYIEGGLAVTPIMYAHYQLAKGEITQAELDNQLADLKKNNFYKQYKEHALLNQVIQQYNIAIRTNGDKSQTNLVVNYTDDNTGIINAYSKQLNISFKGTLKPAKWLDVNYGINAVIGKTRSHSDYNATTPFNVPSYYSLFNEDGSRAQYSLYGFNIYSSYNNVFASSSNLYSLKYNHLDELERNYSNSSTRNTRYFLNLNFKVIDGLTINPQFQYEDNASDSRTHSEAESYTMRWLQNTYTMDNGDGTYTNLLPSGGRLATYTGKSPSYTVRAQANYNKEFGEHAVSIIAGTEFRQTRSYGTNGVLFGYSDQLQTQATAAIDFNTLSNYSSVFWNPNAWPQYSEYYSLNAFGLSTDTKHRYASAYANFTYTFAKKYNIFGSARKDYADMFGGAPKYRGRPLWSVGLAWNISNEDFMKGIEFVNSLKLRASYGMTGNIYTKYNSRLAAEISGNQRYTNLPIATVSTPPNSKLRWEKTATTNIGFDYALFDNRLRGTFDLYWKRGTDLFAKKLMDVTQGYTSLVINNGDMKNKGVELSVSYDWVVPEENGFGWSSGLVLSRNENEITKVDNTTKTASALVGTGAFVKGHPVNSIFSYQYRGLDGSGMPQYLLSDGTLSDDPSSDVDAVVYSGTTDPKINISLSNEVYYRGFSLSILAVYYGGHYFCDQTYSTYSSPSYGPMPNYLLNSWTPTNTDTDIPGSGQYWDSNVNSSLLRNADRWVKHADFIKIRNIVFGYDLPSGFAEKIKVAGVKLRFQIDNPKTLWTKDNLVNDPETGSLPYNTSYIFGVNVNF